MRGKLVLRRWILLITILAIGRNACADNGYNLWLGYRKIADRALALRYANQVRYIKFAAGSETLVAARQELLAGLESMLAAKPQLTEEIGESTLFVGTISSLKLPENAFLEGEIQKTGEEGYLIKSIDIGKKKCIVITAQTDVGVLHGVFAFLKLLQTQESIVALNILEYPRITYRVLDHWDNLNRTIERGYAGSSIWNWHKLPGHIDQRYIDYARASASVGINGSVLNNVNANALMLTPDYLEKVKALANAFRPYGIKVYLSVKFSSPIEIGGLKTADPLDEQVRQWWKDKADEIYRLIPDFGGFLVKANSEGQPGPQAYGRNHADGANMLADALLPHNGIVMWRAFVYDNRVPDDRAKQAYNEFKPLDGQFKKNVIIQVKNGAIDFQPREPFHPLFGAMPNTPLMLEFQLTQEYLGFSTNLVYEAPLFKECLESDTYSMGKGSTVRKIIQGQFNAKLITGMAGVANIGSDINWCGHPFAQANWYAFGRLAWNPEQSSASIAADWLKMTFSNQPAFVAPMKSIMLQSRENTVNYMTPLGLHHIMGVNTHYGPGPWVDNAGRPDWNATYYHKADSAGIGFDRSSTGSNAVAQYQPPVRDRFEKLATCPDEYLLWFHHLKWDYKMRSGNTLWEELVHRYYTGADSVKHMQATWSKLAPYVDKERFESVKQLMAIQYDEATTWRNACVLYFQTFSHKPIPAGYEKPEKPLSYYRNRKYLQAPGIGGNQ
nr:alpha-glucuronidase family glycosyl hydrolase [uncultured Mucilaginibacter sp.]